MSCRLDVLQIENMYGTALAAIVTATTNFRQIANKCSIGLGKLTTGVRAVVTTAEQRINFLLLFIVKLKPHFNPFVTQKLNIKLLQQHSKHFRLCVMHYFWAPVHIIANARANPPSDPMQGQITSIWFFVCRRRQMDLPAVSSTKRALDLDVGECQCIHCLVLVIHYL